MKKIAVVFAVAVVIPSLALAWLAVRSLRHQEFVLERQQSLLCQGISDAVARDVQDAVSEQQHAFNAIVLALQTNRDPALTARAFDDTIRRSWSLAEVGFVVTLAGDILSPSSARAEARRFLGGNGLFLANRESAEVYLNPKQALINSPPAAPQTKSSLQPQQDLNYDSKQMAYNKSALRNVIPQQQAAAQQLQQATDENLQFSKLAPSETEFRQLIGSEQEGTLARFVDNHLCLLFWRRLPNDPNTVYGAQISLAKLQGVLRVLIERAPSEFRQDYCIALLDDLARPVAVSHPGFRANWRRPFVATEIGEVLPHWETTIYLVNPSKLSHTARNIKFALGLLIAVLMLAIVVGSWLIVNDLNRELTLARQKTDFVSNVSHELKTPLTSIRMFSELLADGRVSDPVKRRSYLGIISVETARLTRLINNVLDFARMERGEKKYNIQPCDFVSLAWETFESYRPTLEANGFKFDCDLPDRPVKVLGDRDALAQVILNLLSNAEKYSTTRKEVTVVLRICSTPLPYVELSIRDRGPGIPQGTEEKIFEKFYRAHDSLSSGIQGSGLGLTLARQIARAHGGDIVYEARPDGGSCFNLRLPCAGEGDVKAQFSVKPEAVNKIF